MCSVYVRNLFSLEIITTTNFNLEDTYHNLVLNKDFPISIYYFNNKKKNKNYLNYLKKIIFLI